ncbi:alpha/beta fold hydrolase [Stenotrophobium rhamnosiphilum]|uniref:Alpha/beta hydrolase n=1 Tax=Stenotrophobium rhamnosiphilum TaxID=2029166 RepID=A0A2T5MH14_9GAMM|nr:alpha/beta hydrolase [Stenotrophobium rhamnosiphilum]PTU31868.1 alpha/beta hydrolase [Stenotrophobium rhamnosiphilum]
MSTDPNRTPEWYEGGSGSTLVLLHGFSATWRQWKPLLPLLERHHRVLIPTLPGHTGGISLNKPASPVSISEAFAVQLKARGITQAHFVGNSLGGWMVFEMARYGLARSALGLSPAGAWRDEAEKVAFISGARASFKLLPYVKPLLKLAFSSTALRKRLLAAGMEHGERISAAEARDSLDRLPTVKISNEYMNDHLRPMEPLPADCKVPLRVVWAEKDTVLPFEQWGQPLLDLLGLKTHVVLPGCGHNPVYDDPEGVAAAILEFTRMVESGEA